jgi:hypothetical protein
MEHALCTEILMPRVSLSVPEQHEQKITITTIETSATGANQ